jgi:hypothetical protein
MRPISRRTVLRGAGGIAIALPLLEAMLPRRSHAFGGEAFPNRFVVAFSPNGTIAERWNPIGTASDYSFVDAANPGTLRILAPLEPHKADLIVLQGLDMQSRGHGPGGNGHDMGMGHMLTAHILEEGPSGYGEFSHLPDGSVAGPSIDQAIAELVAETTPYRSLEFGVNSYLDTARQLTSRMCYRGPFEVLPPENDPRAAFDRLFLELGADEAEVAALRAKRRSVLDKVGSDFDQLNAKLGGTDRMKLEAHLDAIRELEMALENQHGLLPGCIQPTMPEEIDHEANDNFPAVGRAQMDLLVMALSCDLTRVCSLQWSVAQSPTRFSWLGITSDHHGMSHEADDDPAIREQLVAINHWYAEQFAYLVDKMKQVDEIDGTLLDHSLALWVNEQGNGDVHSPEEIPFVLAGRASGAIEPGRWLQYEDRAHNDLYVSLLRAFGQEDATTFGFADVCAGALDEI